MDYIDYTERKYPELKVLCRERDLSTTGTKLVLIDRLKEYDTKQEEKANKFSIYVKTMVGSYYTIYPQISSTITEVKELIEDKMGCPVKQQRLFHAHFNTEKSLDDDNRTLADYNIQKQSTIKLYIKLG